MRKLKLDQIPLTVLAFIELLEADINRKATIPMQKRIPGRGRLIVECFGYPGHALNIVINKDYGYFKIATDYYRITAKLHQISKKLNRKSIKCGTLKTINDWDWSGEIPVKRV